MHKTSMMNWVLVTCLLFLVLAAYWGFRRCEVYTPADWGSRGRNRLAGLVVLFCRFYHGLNRQPLPLPEQGPVVVASNHVSGLDPLLLIAASPRPLRFIIAREQYQRFGLNWIFRLAGCIPVDREKRPENALREALRALNQGEVVALFPHGKIHLDSDPPRTLKGGVVFLAQKSVAPICPVRLENIRGQGYTVFAVFIPGQSRLRALPMIQCAAMDQNTCLTQLKSYLETPLEVKD